MNDNPRRLAEIFSPVMNLLHQIAAKGVKQTDLSLPQFRVLVLIRQNDSMSIKDLYQQLSTAQSSASEMIDRLVRLGYLYRKKDPEDRRRTLFKLSMKAERMLVEEMDSMQRVYTQILGQLSQDEQSELLKAFETIEKLLGNQDPAAK